MNFLNKITSIKKTATEDGFYTYANLIHASVLLDTGVHIAISEQRIRFQCADAMEIAKEEMEIKPEWVAVIKKCVSVLSMNTINRDLVDFLDFVEALPENPTS